jgi:hypothetical protein
VTDDQAFDKPDHLRSEGTSIYPRGPDVALDADQVAPHCEGCPWNKATHVAGNEEYELQLCECCALAHDEADGWTVTPLHHQHETR